MMELVWDASFKRAYRKRIAPNKHLAGRFEEAMALFVLDPFEPRLRTHKLTGKLHGYWAFSVEQDCRVLFLFIKGSKRKVLLIDIGSHDEVY